MFLAFLTQCFDQWAEGLRIDAMGDDDGQALLSGESGFSVLVEGMGAEEEA